MIFAWTAHRAQSGKALVTALAFVAGLVLGVGAAIGTNLAGLDLRGKLASANQTEAADKAPVAALAPAGEREVKAMIAELQNLQVKLDEDRKELAVEQKIVAQEHVTIEQLKKEIETAEERLDRFILAKDAGEEKNLKRLAKQWSQMEPVEVYEIAKGLEEATTARILFSMSDRAAAPILAAFATRGADGTRLARNITERLRELTKPPEKPQAESGP